MISPQDNQITPIPEGGLGEGLLSPSRTLASDAILVRRAAKARWPVSDAVKAKLAAKLEDCLDREEDGRIVASLGKVLTAMEGQNQADDHLADKNARLDSGLQTENVGLSFNIVRVEKPPEGEQ
jgi:hypothetical protein